MNPKSHMEALIARTKARQARKNQKCNNRSYKSCIAHKIAKSLGFENNQTIDIKFSSTHLTKHRGHHWTFSIDKTPNITQFLFVAFNNQLPPAPIHVWLIPVYLVNDLSTVTISKKTYNLSAYKLYEISFENLNLGS